MTKKTNRNFKENLFLRTFMETAVSVHRIIYFVSYLSSIISITVLVFLEHDGQAGDSLAEVAFVYTENRFEIVLFLHFILEEIDEK